MRNEESNVKTKAIITGICTVLLLSATSYTAGESPSQSDAGYLDLERVISSGEFDSKSYGSVRWLEDGSGYTTLEDSQAGEEGNDSEDEKPKDIVRYDPQSGEREIMVSSEQLKPTDEPNSLEIDDYSWSPDRKKLLIFTNTKRLWRRNTLGDYWVLDLVDSKLQKLGGDVEPSTLMFAKFAPDGKRVAYVHRKNLYVQNLKDLRITQLTFDGSENLINGTSDWVYEEEFSLRDGFRWSPNGKSIAYWQFDTEGVRDFHLINYTDELYPKITSFEYPKAGQTNSACRVGVINSRGGKTRWFEPSDDLRNHYMPRMDWAENSKEIVFQHLNRLQNTNEITLGNVRKGTMRKIMVERDEAWLDVTDELNLKWLKNGKHFMWLSERDGWQHLYLVSRRGRKVKLLTPGEFDVISIVSIDEKHGWAYYIASPDNPTQRYLYRSGLDGSGKVERVTPAGQAGTHSYQMSHDSKWAIHTYSSANKPPVIDLVRIPEHKTVRVLEDNSQLVEKVAALKKLATEFFRIDIGDGVLLDGYRIKPPDFDPQKQYPLFFYVYGEPAGQTAVDRWGGERYLWHLMLAQQGYLVVNVDNRGTPAPRGRAWRKCIYRQIGILASADQAAATRAIIKEWPYVDPDRIGIWGWSGGGSMSLNAIFRYPELYHTAMAIAFISNQRFYDTIYQERYMGLPDDNEEGFREGSPITFAHQLKGNLLIIHGTADDNCHYQSCQALINELIKHGKFFSMMSYPNRTHSIKEGEGTKRHLYELLTRYLKENLPPGPKSAENP
ncbi:MAG: S9 family peptidase [Phycisphaerae bacterium]|nr:S9 family peptidase [Phycisphaerae bacterium]